MIHSLKKVIREFIFLVNRFIDFKVTAHLFKNKKATLFQLPFMHITHVKQTHVKLPRFRYHNHASMISCFPVAVVPAPSQGFFYLK